MSGLLKVHELTYEIGDRPDRQSDREALQAASNWQNNLETFHKVVADFPGVAQEQELLVPAGA